MKKMIGFLKKSGMWVLFLFFLLSALAFLPSLTSVFFGLVAVILLPVDKWQRLITGKLLKKIGKWKILLIVLLMVGGMVVLPSPEESILEDPVKTEVSTEAAGEVDTEKENQKEETDLPAVVPSNTPEATKESTPESKPEPTPTTTPTPTPEPTPVPTPEPTPEIAQNSYFEIHHLDVGQADAALVMCDDKYLLIDGGNKEDSSLLYSFLKNKEITHLDYVVGTHGHEDHIGGIPGALNYATAGVVYCPVTDYDSDAFRDFKKYVEKAGSTITVPSAGDTFALGSAQIEIVGVNGGSDTNNTSIVLRIVYGDTSFLFTGDAEREAEQVILDAGYEIESTVLKVGHHGSDTSTTYPFLREIMPTYAIISVGEGNSYGHPTDDTLSRLRDAGVKVYRTDLQGDIIVRSDGKNVTIEVEKNPDADTLKAPVGKTQTSVSQTPSKETGAPSAEGKGAYAVNGKNGKIHITGACTATGDGKSAMKEPIYFNTYEEAEAKSIAIAPSEEKRKCGNCWK